MIAVLHNRKVLLNPFKFSQISAGSDFDSLFSPSTNINSVAVHVQMTDIDHCDMYDSFSPN